MHKKINKSPLRYEKHAEMTVEKKSMLTMRMDLRSASRLERITVDFMRAKRRHEREDGAIVSTRLDARPNLCILSVALSALGASRDHSASPAATCIPTHAENTRSFLASTSQISSSLVSSLYSAHCRAFGGAWGLGD